MLSHEQYFLKRSQSSIFSSSDSLVKKMNPKFDEIFPFSG